MDDAVEELLLVEELQVLVALEPGLASLVLEGLDVVEVLRRLDDRHAGVGEVSKGAKEEAGHRDVVGVEDGDEVGIDDI